MHRRHILNGALASLTAALLPDPLSARFGAALAAPGKTIVVLFQRGGCDGLNTIVPFADDDYYDLRPNIAIAEPSPADPLSALDLNGFFGFHPALSPLRPMYTAGEIAILPTVGFDGISRSHAHAQRAVESGALGEDLDGWLNRYLASRPLGGAMPAVDMDSFLAHAMSGDTPVSSVNSLFALARMSPSNQQASVMAELGSIYAQSDLTGRPYRQQILDTGQAMLGDFETVRGLGSDYVAENGAVYPDSLLGQKLKQTAQLVKSGVGVEVVALSAGGWDTHTVQGGGETDGRQAKALSTLANAVAAFRADMGTDMDRVLLLAMTEFGRTAAENSSLGTDHGHASAWMAIGGNVNGGLHLGPQGWPGLGPSQLEAGRYLAHTVDYRDVLGEVMNRFLGVSNPSSFLEGHNYSPIGFLRT